MTLGLAEFDPRSLGTMGLWLDAMDFGTIALNGSTVSQWNDKSGNGNNAVQGTEARQPIYDADGLNSLPTLINDATDVLVVTDSASLDLSSGACCFIAAERTVDNGTNEYFIWKNGGAGNNELLFLVNGSDQLQTSGSQDGTDSVNTSVSSPTIALATPFIVSFYQTGGNLHSRLNMGAPSSAAFTGFFNSTRNLEIFAVNAAGPFTGKISEILLYTVDLSLVDVAKVTSYLSHKWNITL